MFLLYLISYGRMSRSETSLFLFYYYYTFIYMIKKKLFDNDSYKLYFEKLENGLTKCNLMILNKFYHLRQI